MGETGGVGLVRRAWRELLVRFSVVLDRVYPVLVRNSAVLVWFFPHLERSGTFSAVFGCFGAVSDTFGVLGYF